MVKIELEVQVENLKGDNVVVAIDSPIDVKQTSQLDVAKEQRPPVVLFVDDDPHLISAVQRSFRPYRVQLEVAFHGMQGVVSAVEIRPDVIVTDLQMPFATGDELVECLSRHPATAGVPIVIVTGRPGVSLSAKYRRLGVHCVLAKPLRFEDLLRELKSLITIEQDGK